jgi:hypothetical protein
MFSGAAKVAPTFVLLREKVRAVRSVRATDGIVLEAQEAIWNAIVQNANTITQSRGYLWDGTQRLGQRLVGSGT